MWLLELAFPHMSTTKITKFVIFIQNFQLYLLKSKPPVVIEQTYYSGQFLKVSFARLIRAMSAFDGFRFNSLTTAARCSSVKGGIGSGSTFLTHPAFIQQYYGTCTVQ